MCAKDLPQLFMTTLAEQVEINVTQGGQESVRIVSSDNSALHKEINSIVRDGVTLDLRYPNAPVLSVHRNALIREHHPH